PRSTDTSPPSPRSPVESRFRTGWGMPQLWVSTWPIRPPSPQLALVYSTGPGGCRSGLFRGARGLCERVEEPAALVRLGMPLDAEHPAAVVQLDRLRKSVLLCPAGHDEPVPEPVDGLVVVAACGVHLLAGGARGERAGVERDDVVGAVEGADRAPVGVRAVHLRDVLKKRPAERHVERLHAAAHAEHGHAALDRAIQQSDLEGVAVRVGGLDPWIWLLAI